MKKKVFIIAGALVLIATTVCAKNNIAKSNNSTVTINIERGIQAFESDNTGMAMYYFEKELDENPQNGYAWHFVSITKYYCGEINTALDAANTAIEYLPTMDFSYRSLAHTLRGDIYLSLEDTINCIKNYNQAIELAPDNIDVLLSLAQVYYELGDYDLSGTNYRQVLSHDKNNLEGHMGLARNEYSQGNYKETLKYCNNAISIQQDFSPAYTGKADCYIRMKKYDMAIDNIVTAIEIGNNQRADMQLYWVAEEDFGTVEKKLKLKCKQNPDNIVWAEYLASLYYDSDDYKKAIELYKLYPELEKQQYVLYRMAHYYDLFGEYEEALYYIDRAIEADTTGYESLMYKADYLYETGNFAEAIDQATEYIEHFPDYFYGYYRRGFYKDNTADYDGAIEDYTIAIALEPTYAYASLGRADMYNATGKKELAYADYKKVIELDTIPSDNACAQFAYMELGETEKAIEFMKQIIANNSDDAGCYYDAACLYARIGDKDTSLTMLEIALRKGYKRFAHIENDGDLENIRTTNEYKKLIKKYK